MGLFFGKKIQNRLTNLGKLTSWSLEPDSIGGKNEVTSFNTCKHWHKQLAFKKKIYLVAFWLTNAKFRKIYILHLNMSYAVFCLLCMVVFNFTHLLLLVG